MNENFFSQFELSDTVAPQAAVAEEKDIWSQFQSRDDILSSTPSIGAAQQSWLGRGVEGVGQFVKEAPILGRITKAGEAMQEQVETGIEDIKRGGTEFAQGVKELDPTKAFGGALGVAGGVGKQAFTPITAIAGAAEPEIQAAGTAIASVIPDSVKEGIADFMAKIPEEEKQRYEDFLNATGLLTLLSSPVQKGVIQSAKGAAKVVEKGAEVATVPTRATGRIMKETGETLYESAITPTVKEAERILSFEAKNPFLKRASSAITGKEIPNKPILRSTTAAEKGLIGRQQDIGIQAKREADRLWKEEIDPIIEKSNVKVTKDELFAPIKKRINETTDPSKKKAYEEAFEALQEDYINISDFSLKEAQKLKSELDEFTPEKIFKGKNVANEFKVLQNDMANAIRTRTYNAFSEKSIRKKYLDWANLKELQKIGVKAIAGTGTKGGFGGFWSTMWDKVTTPITTISGYTLYRVGNKLEFIGKKGIKKFGDYLEETGFEKPLGIKPANKPTKKINNKKGKDVIHSLKKDK